ncbi:unnamed protein product, partial [Brenthis ino]
MGVFDFLPIFNQCCFCLNLKIGSILIAIWGILSVGSFTYFAAFPVCFILEGIALTIMKIARLFVYFCDGVLFITAIIFIIGVFIKKSITAEIFLFGIALVLVGYMLYTIATVITYILHEECRYFVGPEGFTLNTFLWIYFMIIIRSYKEEME